MALFVLCKRILQTRMHSHPVRLDVWFLVGPFVFFHTSCVRTTKALARLRGCAGSPEPSLFAYVISTIILWAGSFMFKSIHGCQGCNVCEETYRSVRTIISKLWHFLSETDCIHTNFGLNGHFHDLWVHPFLFQILQKKPYPTYQKSACVAYNQYKNVLWNFQLLSLLCMESQNF